MKRGTLIAVGVFAALLLITLATREEKVSVGVKKLELPAVDTAKVVALEMTGAKAATLRKEGAVWLVSSPAAPDKKFPADDAQVKSALEALKAFGDTELITEKPEKHAELEVDDAKGLKVTVTLEGEKPLALVMGKGAKGGGHYVRRAGEDAVFATKGRFGWMVRKEVVGWRKRGLFNAKAQDARELTFHHREGTQLKLTSADGTSFALAEGTATPTGYRFDAGAGARVAQQLVSLSASDFLDSPDFTDEQLGLSGAHDRTEARLQDSTALVVHLGREPVASDAMHAGALKTHFDALDALDAKDGALTRAELAKAGVDKKLEAAARDAAAHLAQDDQAWARFDVGAYGATSKDDKVTQADLDAVARTSQLVPVRVEGNPQTYLVGNYSVAQLRKRLDDLRDTTLLSFEPEKVARVTLTSGKKRAVVAKDGAGWKVVEPKALPAGLTFDPAQVTAQLAQLKALKAARYLDPAPGEASAGLNAPLTTVELALEGGGKQTLKFGKELTNAAGAKEHYVKGSADGHVYAIGSWERSRFDQGIELFKKAEPPPNFGGGGGIKGLENLPPEVRRQLEAQLRNHP